MQAVNESRRAVEIVRKTAHRESQKKLKKLLKNLLTKRNECDIMCFTSALKKSEGKRLEKSRKNLKKF